MESPDANLIASLPVTPNTPRSITSIDGFQLCLLTHTQRLARDADGCSLEPGDHVTSIEYLQDECPGGDEGGLMTNPVNSGRDEFEFLSKVNFDREKFFRLHCKIEQPEKQLIQETLNHFQRKSVNTSEQMKASAVQKHRKVSEATTTTSEKQHEREMMPLSARESRRPMEEIKNREAKSTTNRLCRKQTGMFGGARPFRDCSNKENENLGSIIKNNENLKMVESTLRMTIQNSVKKSLPKLAEAQSLIQKDSSTFSQRKSTVKKSASLNTKTAKTQNHVCQCRTILQKIDQTSKQIKFDFVEKVIRKLAAVNKSLSSIKNHYASNKAANQATRPRLQTIDEYPELNSKSSIKPADAEKHEHRFLAIKCQDASLSSQIFSSAKGNAWRPPKPSGSLTDRLKVSSSLVGCYRRANPFKV
jgi:hypothetical protein